MKLRFTKSLIIISIFLSSAVLSQNLPNGGFENWNGSAIVDWYHNGTDFIPTVVKTVDSYGGNYAVYGSVFDFGGTPFPPVLYVGEFASPLITISDNYTSLEGWYKYHGEGGDMLYIQVTLGNLTTGGGAEGHTQISAEASSWTEFNIPITYDDDNPPGWQANNATVTITIQPATGQIPHVGTYFYVDNVSFNGEPLDVKENNNGIKPDEFKLVQNYPNPFNPTTNIEFAIPEESHVNLTIYNMLGEQVAVLVDEILAAGGYTADWNASDLPSGTYLYKITANNFSRTKKMILLK